MKELFFLKSFQNLLSTFNQDQLPRIHAVGEKKATQKIKSDCKAYCLSSNKLSMVCILLDKSKYT